MFQELINDPIIISMNQVSEAYKALTKAQNNLMAAFDGRIDVFTEEEIDERLQKIKDLLK